MAPTPSLKCLSCRIPYQSLHSLNAFSRFSEKTLLFTDFCFVASPSQTQKKRDVHKFPPAILGPEMAAPILWAPGLFWFFLLENPHAHKIPPFGGGGGGVGVLLKGGGWKCQFYFYGRGDFSDKLTSQAYPPLMPWGREVGGRGAVITDQAAV